MEVKVTNNIGRTQPAHFEMFIPKEAFVSNYTMIIKDVMYFAKVEAKATAKDIYGNSTDNVGLIQENHWYTTNPRDMKKV